MNDAYRFRMALRTHLLRIVALSALGALGDGLAACGPLRGQTTQCFAWPPSDAGTDGGGGAGGEDGGLQGGAGGSGGAAGSSGAAACPAATEAADQIQRQFDSSPGLSGCKVISVDGEATAQSGMCCYLITQQCPSLGRPFLVEGRARTAARAGAGTESWRIALAPRLDSLPPDARTALAEAWLSDALSEHASIASFARASLELMALGAPAPLIEAAHRAALDETRHAQMCFTLASAYAGRELGPGAFPFGGAVAISGDLATVAARVAIEGCVGETLAAIQASEQLAVAVDPAVIAVLASIAEDEARHAELAWRTVAWALRVGGGDVRRAIGDAFSEASAVARTGDDGPADLAAVLAAHGRLDGAASGRVLSRALDEVVLVAAGVLLGRDDPRRALASIV